MPFCLCIALPWPNRVKLQDQVSRMKILQWLAQRLPDGTLRCGREFRGGAIWATSLRKGSRQNIYQPLERMIAFFDIVALSTFSLVPVLSGWSF